MPAITLVVMTRFPRRVHKFDGARRCRQRHLDHMSHPAALGFNPSAQFDAVDQPRAFITIKYQSTMKEGGEGRWGREGGGGKDAIFSELNSDHRHPINNDYNQVIVIVGLIS